jgi:hypothetical protein
MKGFMILEPLSGRRDLLNANPASASLLPDVATHWPRRDISAGARLSPAGFPGLGVERLISCLLEIDEDMLDGHLHPSAAKRPAKEEDEDDDEEEDDDEDDADVEDEDEEEVEEDEDEDEEDEEDEFDDPDSGFDDDDDDDDEDFDDDE